MTDPSVSRSAPATAVLFSAGLDSAVLLAAEAVHGPVQPIYVSVGLAWEAAERQMAAVLLASPAFAAARPMTALRFPMEDVYPASHWAIRGEPPGYDTPDEDVYLAGRNLILLSKAGVYCAQHHLSRIVLGPLAGNPFPDARPEFYEAMAAALSLGLDRPLRIEAPFARLHKEDVIRLGLELNVPLELTLSCMAPSVEDVAKVGVGTGPGHPGVPEFPRLPVHCGACSKCRERQHAFQAAGVADPTKYRVPARSAER